MQRIRTLSSVSTIVLVLGAFATTSVAYGDSDRGSKEKRKAATPNAKQLVTVTNITDKSLKNIQVTFSGKDPGDFRQTNNCGKELNRGKSCVISVTFMPKTPGAKSATMEVLSSEGTQRVTLTGAGI